MNRLLRAVSVAVTGASALTFGRSAAGGDLKTGDEAPEFIDVPGTDGKSYSLSQLKGKPVVLAWYPKAFTGG